MTNLLKLSADVIDGRIGIDEVGPLNRINFQLSELADDIAMVEAFSHSILFKPSELATATHIEKEMLAVAWQVESLL